MLRCRLLGHRYRFRADGATMRWECERGCGEAGGSKRYASARDARRYASALDRDPRDGIGRRAPLGLLPLRMWRGARDRAERDGRAARDRAAGR